MIEMKKPMQKPPLGSPLGFRVDPELKAALGNAAKDDARSVSSLAQKIITEWLKAKGYLK
jgi:hypothetical protein